MTCTPLRPIGARPLAPRRALLATALRLVLALAAFSPLAAPTMAAARVVFDPSNFAQNVVQAAHALRQVTQQVQQLQNEAQMLVNDAQNLAALPHSSLQQLMASVGRTQGLLTRAEGIAYEVAEIEGAFTARYGDAASLGSAADLVAMARDRWQESVAALQDTLRVQAGVVGNLGSAGATMQTLVGQSQGAVGALQAAQAGNQILALQASQLGDLTAIVAAQGRAQALDQARAASAEAQARENLRRFLTPGGGYQPGAARMFGN